MEVPKTNETKLSDRQLRALPCFLQSDSIEEICRQAKISKCTYYEWIKEPAFRSELRKMRDELVIDAVETLKIHATHAVETLVKLLDSTTPSLQRQVANDILAHIAQFKELQEIEKRLQVLEAK